MTWREEEDKKNSMTENLNDPDPDKRITNSDEQDVAVNHSTKEEGGYDEPVSQSGSETNQDMEEAKPKKEKKKDSFKSDKIN
jgi:hypothetical protein